MRIAITGAAGGIGRRLTSVLSDRNELVLLDSVSPEEATVFDPGSPTGRTPSPLTPDWPYHVVDITNPESLTGALQGVDAVVHLAGWLTGEWENAHSIMMTNAMGTFNVYEAARSAGVRRVVAASSINAFGSIYWRVSGFPAVRDRLPLNEDAERVPEDPYSLSKGVGEDIGATFNRAFGIESVSLRFSGVWNDHTYQEALEKGLAVSAGWADSLWTWVHVEDVVSAVSNAVHVAAVVSSPMTIAAADTTAPESSLELIRTYRPELEHRLTEPLIGRASLLSIARARLVLGYEPRYDLEAAARKTRENRD